MSTLRFGERARKVTNFSRVNETEQQTSLTEMKKMLLLAKSEITNLRMENLLLRRTSLLSFVGGRESTPTSEKIVRTNSTDSFDTISRKNEKIIEDELLRNEILQLRSQNEELITSNNYMKYQYKNNKNENTSNSSFDSITIIKSHNGSGYNSDNGENCSENGKNCENSEVVIGEVYRRKSSKFFEFHFAEELAGIAVTDAERRGSENFRRLSLSMSKKEIMKDSAENNEFNNDGENVHNQNICEESSINKNNFGESDIVPRNVPQNILEICPRNRNDYSNEKNRNKRENKNLPVNIDSVSTNNVSSNGHDDNDKNNNENENENDFNIENKNLENIIIDEETKKMKNDCEEGEVENEEEKEVVIKVVDKFAEDYEALQLILSIEEKLIIIDDYMKFNGNGDQKKEKAVVKRIENEVGKKSVRLTSNKTEGLEKEVEKDVEKEVEKDVEKEVEKNVEKEGEKEVEKDGVMNILFNAFSSPFFSQSVAENSESDISPILSPLPLSPSSSSFSDVPISESSTPLTPATSTSFPINSSIQIKEKIEKNGIKSCHSENESMTPITDNIFDENNSELKENKKKENDEEKNFEKIPRHLQLNRNLQSKRGLKKKSKKDSIEDGEKLKTEINGIVDDTRLNVLSGFFDIVSSVFSPVKGNDVIVTTDSTPYTERDDSNYDINDDGNSAEIVKNLENRESTTCLPVGYYDSDLKQFCRVLPKYEISVKKNKKKDNFIDFTGI